MSRYHGRPFFEPPLLRSLELRAREFVVDLRDGTGDITRCTLIAVVSSCSEIEVPLTEDVDRVDRVVAPRRRRLAFHGGDATVGDRGIALGDRLFVSGRCVHRNVNTRAIVGVVAGIGNVWSGSGAGRLVGSVSSVGIGISHGSVRRRSSRQSSVSPSRRPRGRREGRSRAKRH